MQPTSSYSIVLCKNVTNGGALGYIGGDPLCSGNRAEIGGGSSRISLFSSTTFFFPVTLQNIGSYTHRGCYQELSFERLLSGAGYTDAVGITGESCVAFCLNRQQMVARVEYLKYKFPAKINRRRMKLLE